MRPRSSRRFRRFFLAALTASVAPIALYPSLAQESDSPGLSFKGVTQSVTNAFQEVTKGWGPKSWGMFQRKAPYENPNIAPYFDGGIIPLELQPDRLVAFDTANMLPKNTFSVYVGTSQTNPSDSIGTGNQTYFTGVRYQATDNLTLGFDYWNYDDRVITPINGFNTQIIMQPVEISGRLKVFDKGNISGAVQASFGYFTQLQTDADVFGGIVDSGDRFFGSLKAPITIDKSPKLQFHVTPSISIFPDTVDAGTKDFYGTIFSLGAGVSYKPSNRSALYATLEMPFGDNGNTLTDTAGFENKLVWTAGGRYNITPKLAIDGYLTNGLGMSPSTSVLTHFPNGDDVLLGARLTYTPGVEIKDTYRGRPKPLDDRQMRVQQDGLILGVADTLDPGTTLVGAWYGTDEHYGAQFSWGIDRDFQADFILEDFASGTIDPTFSRVNDLRYMVGPKVRILDQNQGDKFSLSARALYGRNFDTALPFFGVFYAEGLASYSIKPELAINGAVKVMGFADTAVYGLGAGINYEIRDGLQLIGEAHFVGGDSDEHTWAVGARYTPPGGLASVDLTATNATGRYGLGTLVAQDEINVSLGVATRFSIR